MKIGLIALALALVAAQVYVVKHHQPATQQIAGPPGSIDPCPPLCGAAPQK
jgi:hypothetical protein